MAELYQLTFNGLTIGDQTPFDILNIDGLESFESTNSDRQMPALWGSLPGLDRVQSRMVMLELSVAAGEGYSAQQNVHRLEVAFRPNLPSEEDVLFDCVYELVGRDDMLIRARCRRRDRRVNREVELGLIPVMVLLEAPDPRRYAAEETVNVALFDATSLTAIDFNATEELNFDASEEIDFASVAGVSADVTISNEGNVDAYPIVHFVGGTAGAMTDFKLTNITTGEVLRITTSVNIGEYLIADMEAIATGKAGLPISLGGASRYGDWEPPRVPLRFKPGVNVLRFEVTTGSSTGAYARVYWRDAYL